MERRTVQLRVAGQTYKVVSNAEVGELSRLASAVEAKLAEVSRGRATSPQGIFLAALALAHELEEERARREALERRTRDLLRRALLRIDDVLESASA